jgi:hypothetical protein
MLAGVLRFAVSLRRRSCAMGLIHAWNTPVQPAPRIDREIRARELWRLKLIIVERSYVNIKPLSQQYSATHLLVLNLWQAVNVPVVNMMSKLDNNNYRHKRFVSSVSIIYRYASVTNPRCTYAWRLKVPSGHLLQSLLNKKRHVYGSALLILGFNVS